MGREGFEDMIGEFAGALENLAYHGRVGNDLLVNSEGKKYIR